MGYRGDRGQLTIGVDYRSYIKNKTCETRVNISENATATAAKSAITSYCEHIYDLGSPRV